ncbi:MAG: hypothetical protein WC216_02370 [Gallionella sp.]
MHIHDKRTAGEQRLNVLQSVLRSVNDLIGSQASADSNESSQTIKPEHIKQLFESKEKDQMLHLKLKNRLLHVKNISMTNSA